MFSGSEYLYYVMYLVGFAIMMILNIKDRARYKIEKRKAVIYTLITYVYGVVGAMIMGSIYTAAAKHLGSNEVSRVAIFGAVIFTPIFLVLTFLLMRSDWRRNLDFLTPGIFIILACAKLGCFLDGCCAGFAWEKGIYNPRLGFKVFPVQIFESATMVIVIIATQLFCRKYKNYVKGMAYPVTAAVYSVTRFCWEEARYYSTQELSDVFLGLTFWQLSCIFVFLASIIMILVLKSKKVKEYDEKKAAQANAKKIDYKKYHKKRKKKSK